MVSKTRKSKKGVTSWGYHLLINAGGCDPVALRSKETIAAFAKALVKRIDMVAFGEPMIVRFGDGNKMGYSLVQLIETSNISGHFVEETNDIYLDIFSCKSFKVFDAMAVFNEFFNPVTVEKKFVVRQAAFAGPRLPRMKRVSIAANTFEIMKVQDGQNPYIHGLAVDPKTVLAEHRRLERAFKGMYTYAVHPTVSVHLPDIVFVANGGLSLPRLSKPTVILPWMKYPQRRAELPFLKEMFKELKVRTVEFPGSALAPFEGQAELKWFCGGTKAICAYGYRSTLETFRILDRLFKKLYSAEGLDAPQLLVVPIASFDYYHLDVGMLEYDDTKCIVHKDAFSPTSIKKMRDFLGSENVTVLDTKDTFCLNAVVDGGRLITHRLTESGLKDRLETITGKKVVEIDTTEFEKSGGSVRCMTLDLFL